MISAAGTVPAWVAFAGLIVTLVVALGAEILRGRQAVARDREQRAADRQAARDEARDNFERDTLLELQDAVTLMMRNCARSVHTDEVRFRKTGEWGRDMLPDEVGGEPALGFVRNVQRLRVRALDPDLRELIGSWLAQATYSTMGVLGDETDEQARARSLDAEAKGSCSTTG